MNYVTKEEFNKLKGRVEGIEKKISGGVADSVKERPESLTEFLNRKNLKSNTDKTICIAHFLENRAGEGVTSADVVGGFRESRNVVPSNVSDQLAKCAKKGFIQVGGERGGKKVWTLTNTGIEHVKDIEKEEEK